MSSKSKRFSLKRKTLPLELEGEDGVVHTYTLRELSGSERDRYLNEMATKMRMDATGKPAGIKDFTNLQSSLIQLSLVDDTNKAIPLETIQTWPAEMQTEVFQMAQKLSGLGDTQAQQNGALQEAKND